MELIELFSTPDRKDYKCYELLDSLLTNDEFFRNTILEGYKDGKIRGFDESMWENIKSQNIRANGTFEDVFKTGYNLGNCTGCSLQYSYSLDKPYICGGELPILKGTPNSPDGRHTWIECDGKIIDTTLMLVIDKSYVDRIGYYEENKYDPNMNPRYRAAKDFANDPDIRKGRNK